MDIMNIVIDAVMEEEVMVDCKSFADEVGVDYDTAFYACLQYIRANKAHHNISDIEWTMGHGELTFSYRLYELMKHNSKEMEELFIMFGETL